jgi:bifunctional UDP-N-acetylglucosamine pyrophosphorylase/glucosamine-1-phosphate N-acetyltransferase
MDSYITVVLAAGKGKRMQSALPKVLHPLAGLPLLGHVLKTVEAIPTSDAFASLEGHVTASKPPIVVLGHEAEQVQVVFGDQCWYAIQDEQLGTGHAVLAAQSTVQALNPLPDTVLVCYGDTPLVRSEVLASVLAEHYAQRATVTFLTAYTDDPSDFGRVVRAEDGRVLGIVEVKRATEEQKLIKEVNSGVYCFERDWLWKALQALPRNPAGEYYLTDLVEMAAREGREIATVAGTLDETIGVNNRVQLAEAERILRLRILERHMYAGVTIVDPANTYIDEVVQIGRDTVILPGCMITGKTSIGSDCKIGPASVIEDSQIEDGCRIRNSVIEEAYLEQGVTVGPFSHCRPGAHLARNVRMGNFGEVKNSYIGAETDMHHFSYIGDSTVGQHVNIGAGTVTSNYNGLTKQKNRTVIEDGAFIGCDTILVPPITVGKQAMTGGNSLVNRDVPPNTLVVGIPARVLRELPTTENSPQESNEKE